MAGLPQFGGTNNVPELDIGQTGGARATAATARYRPNVIMDRPESAKVANSLPEQARTFVAELGFTGQMVTWTGSLLVTDDDELASIESELSVFKTGQAITLGVRGAVDESKLLPTRLTNMLGRILSESAVLHDYRFPDRQVTLGPASTPYTILKRLTLTFRIVK